jgi:AbrB family looped-hinge helix DNA binding protein
MIAKLGPKGQIVIPKEIRDELGVGPGSAVSLRLRSDGLVEMARAWNDPIADGPAYVQAAFPPGTPRRSADEILREIDLDDEEINERQYQRWFGKRSS